MSAPSTIESSIQRWAHPRVLVLASGEVERMLAKNHLTFAELLKPLGAQLENVPAVYFRSVTKNYTLKHFGVKFVAPLELEAAAALALPFEGAAGNSPVATSNIASTEQYLDSVLRSNEPPRDRYTDGIQEQADVSGFLRTTPDPTVWFSKYRSEFHEVLRYHESELIDQPLALLVAVSTTDANPLNLIEQLRGLRNLPAVFQKGVYDSASNLLRSIVVLHDKHAELNDPDAKERGANTFRLIKKQYGTEVLRMLELNSLPLDQPNLKQKDLWKTDCERTKWQLQQVRRRANENSTSTPSPPPAVTTSSPSPMPYPLIQPIPSPMPTHAPILNSSSSASVQANLPHPSPILTTSSGTEVPLSEGTPEPSTPSSQSIASLSAATSALTTNALEEMGADEAATVEEEQAQLKLKQQEEALRAQVIQQQNQAQAQQLAQSSVPISSGLSPASADASSSSSSSSLLSNSASSPTSASLLDRSVPAGQARGQFLSPQDLVQTSAFIGDFLLKSLLPHLERKMSVLGEKVAAVRKGFKNSLKAFFGKQRDTSKKASFNMRLGTYDWNTIESQARQLADLAFVVQDYELAASTYRVCAGDYKQDKIPRHFAGSQEMLGLAIALGDNSGVINSGTIRDLTQAFEGAVSSFLSVGDVRRATRSSWFFSDCLRWIGGQTKVNECSAILLRASEKEQSVRAALCMEQAAYLFLYHIPTPLVRKYSFHLVMAGHIYHKYLQKIFGVRAYNAATILYEHRAWFSVNDHLNYNLAKEYFHLNRYEESVKHFIELIGKSQSVAGIKPKQTQEKQTVFLKEFVFVIKKWQELEQAKQAQLQASGGAGAGAPHKSQQVPGLKLPTVLDESISVRTNDRDTVPAAYTIQGWNLALRVNPLMTLEKDQCNKPLFTPGWNSYREADRGAVVNETITLQFQISNPLLIELPCSNLRLKCKWKNKAVDGQPEEEVESRDGVAEGQPIHEQAVFVYSTLSITLQPLQTASVSLTVRPLKQGTMYIEGMNWEVMEVLKGFHPFALPLRQVTFPVVGGRRRKPELQQDPSLIVPITPPAPLLSIQLSSIPSHLHHSEVVRVTMQLTNHGSVGLHAMCLRFSHPGFMILTNHSAGGKETPFHHTWNEGYIQLPFTLAPQQSLELPLYIRGTLEGKHQLSMLLKYEPVQSPSQAGTLKHRLCHLTFPLLVTPLLNVSVFTRPSFQWLHDSLLGVEIADAQQSIPSLASTIEYRSLQSMDVRTMEVRVNRLSCLSKMWSIAPLTAREGAAHSDASHHNHHDGLVPPRALHESVSTPLALKAAAAGAVDSTTFADTPAGGAGQAHLLRPYESLLHFFRVSNMEGTFGLSHSTHAHSDKPVHTSASANNLPVARDESATNATSKSPQPMTHAQGLAARKPTHSSVSLSSAAGHAETNPQSLDLDPSHPAIAHLLHMEKALMVEAEKQTLIVNPAAVLADVGAPNRLDVALCWRSVDGIRGGIYHTPGLACMKARPSACSLKVLLHFPREISHDFLGEGSLDVPVHVAIRNTLEDAAVTFSFETLPPEEEFDANKRAFKLQSSPCLRGRYTWSGSTKCRVTALSPGEEVSVNLFAFFQAPGVYNLNRFRFTVEVAGKKPRVFFFPLQHLIHITQAATSFHVGHHSNEHVGVNGVSGNAAAPAEGAEGAQRAEAGVSEDLLSLGQPEEVISETQHSHSEGASASDPSAPFSFNSSSEGGIGAGVPASSSTDDMQVSELGTSVDQEEDSASSAAEGATQAASEIQDDSEQ